MGDVQIAENHELLVNLMMTSIWFAGKEQMGSSGREMSYQLQI